MCLCVCVCVCVCTCVCVHGFVFGNEAEEVGVPIDDEHVHISSRPNFTCAV